MGGNGGDYLRQKVSDYLIRYPPRIGGFFLCLSGGAPGGIIEE